MNLLHSLYQFITLLLSPLMKAIILWRAARGKEDKTRLEEKWGMPSEERLPGRPLYWIHAVSVGEANSALILIKLLQELVPHAQILMTTGTVTSANLMVEKLPEGAIHQYFPLDTPFAVRCFLDHWNPALALWIESEIWPNMLLEMKQRKIPLLLLNGRMSPRSVQRWKKVLFFISPLMKAFTWCGVQTSRDRKAFLELGAPFVEVMPNLKLLTDVPAYCQEEYGALQKSLGTRFRWFASCTHPGEEEELLAVHKRVLETHPEALLFLAPRHVVRVEKVKEAVEKAQLCYGVRSAGSLPQPKDQVYIIDSMGELGLFYKVSPMTFIGGTWIPKGGHNPFEAAQMGSYVFHGRFIESNQVLYEVLDGLGLCHLVSGPESLCSHLVEGAPRNMKAWEQLRASGLEDLRALLEGYVKEKKEKAC